MLIQNTSTFDWTQQIQKMIPIVYLHGLRPHSLFSESELASFIFQRFSVLASSGVFQLAIHSFLDIFVMGYFKFLFTRDISTALKAGCKDAGYDC